MTSQIPSDDVIRHWIAWTYSSETPEEFIEHDAERVKLFERWLYEERNRVWNMMAKIERDSEQKRITELLDKEDLLPRLNTPQGNWVHIDTLKALIKGENK